MFGSHLSIAGGMHNAIARARELEFATVQVFTKNQKTWASPPMDSAAAALWKSHLADSLFEQTVSHDSYLINLGSADATLRAKSIALMEDEIRRCEMLGIGNLVSHPGAHLGERDNVENEIEGLERIASALSEVFAKLPRQKTIVCLEATAGQGTSLGHKLEHLGHVIKLLPARDRKRMGVCLDTAHLFAAGYDFRGTRKYNAFIKQLDQHIGLDRVKVWHLNDSKKALGSRVDRHDHIGAGHIGLTGFEPIVRDKRWDNVPKILETPTDKREDGVDWDTVNLQTLMSMRKK